MLSYHMFPQWGAWSLLQILKVKPWLGPVLRLGRGENPPGKSIHTVQWCRGKMVRCNQKSQSTFLLCHATGAEWLWEYSWSSWLATQLKESISVNQKSTWAEKPHREKTHTALELVHKASWVYGCPHKLTFDKWPDLIKLKLKWRVS